MRRVVPPVVFVRWKKRTHATPIQRGRARCAHEDLSDTIWTPVLLHSQRVDGSSRHVRVAGLTSIRECCIRDATARSAWWLEIFRDLDGLRGRGVLGDPGADPRVPEILAALRNVVPFERPRRRPHATHATWSPRRPRRQADIAPAVDETTCFSILGVSSRCSTEELKRAWRREAAAHHPDRGGHTESFRRAKAAYDLCRSIRGF